MALSGPFAGEYGEPDIEMIVEVISHVPFDCTKLRVVVSDIGGFIPRP